MDRLALDQGWLQKGAGLVAGILIGFVLGPLSFIPLGVPFAAAASFGCLAGAVAGYFTVSLLVHRRKAAIDRELESAISAVRVEAGLPDTIQIHVKDAYAVLEGSVAHASQAIEAEGLTSTIPGIRGVINRIGLRPPATA